MMDRGGERVKIGPWLLGPGHRPQGPPDQSTNSNSRTDYKFVNQEEIRVAMQAKWEKYYRHAAGHIPYAVCKANGAPPLGDSEEQDFEMGGIDFDEGESEIEEPLARNHTGRPSDGEGNILKTKFGWLTFIFIVKRGPEPDKKPNVSETQMIKITTKV